MRDAIARMSIIKKPLSNAKEGRLGKLDNADTSEIEFLSAIPADATQTCGYFIFIRKLLAFGFEWELKRVSGVLDGEGLSNGGANAVNR